MNCLLCNRVIRSAWPLGFLLLPQKYQMVPTCEQCLSTFQKIEAAKSCPVCGRTQSSTNLCHDCQKWQVKSNYVFHNQALYTYNAAMKQYMHDYKFQGDYRLRHVFCQQFEMFIKAQKPSDFVVPLPIDEQTWQTRGFNQVIGLIGDLAVTNLLVMHRKKDEKRQSQKKRQDRLRTINHFQIAENWQPKVKNKKILLVDDVYTTGRTMRHAAETLYTAGAGLVECITLCR